MMLKKKGYIGVILATALMLASTISAFADEDEAPITVVIIKDSTGAKEGGSIDANYVFESDLASEDVTKLFEENSEKVAAALNNRNKRKVTIDESTYQFLTEFVDTYYAVYLTKTMPDMDTYYDLSSNARKENKLSVEAYTYKNAVVKSNKVESVDSILNITEVTPITDNVDEILFYVQRTIHTNEGDERGGTWFLAHVATTSDTNKFLKVWIQDYVFEMMQNNIKSNYLSRDVDGAKDALAQDILTDYEANKIKNLTKAPAESR